MAIEIPIPNLPGIEAVTLVRWLKQPGEIVEAGDEIAEIESDKATVPVEAPGTGKLGRHLVNASDQSVACGTVIAFVLTESEPEPEVENRLASEVASETATTSTTETAAVAPTAAPTISTHEGQRVFSSPLARRLAKQNGVDLGEIKGSGPRGRIVRIDIEHAIDNAPPAPTHHREPLEVPRSASETPEFFAGVDRIYEGRVHERIAHSSMRRTIADRLTRSKQTVPHYYLTRDIELDALMSLRSQINSTADSVGGPRISLNDLFIKALAIALQQVPDCNVVWSSTETLRLATSDIGVAIAVENGLYTPVLRDVQLKSASTISAEMKDYIERAKARKLTPLDLEGGAVTISNLGMFGVDSFQAIINTPHSAILSIGRARWLAIYDDETGKPRRATVASFTLSVDHRVIDGARGATLLSTYTELVEEPIQILV